MMGKYYCISEYSYLASKKNTNFVDKGSALLPGEVFDELESFVLEGQNEADIQSAFLRLSYKKGVGKILKAQNYVGIIQTKSGVTIEILPKIYEEDSENSTEKTKIIFFKMLKSLKQLPFKKFNLANLKSYDMKLLDVFISMFLYELKALIKKGIKSGYVNTEENINFYKGKLNVNGHIRLNVVHKERFYVQFDNYSKDISENRIIKSTLIYLKSKTTNSTLQNEIRKSLFIFDEVEVSKNYSEDFNKCINNRIMDDYDNILQWCKIFLSKQSFTNYNGASTAYALLFPMEKIFEYYVAKQLKESECFKNYNMDIQYGKLYLLEKPKKFKLIPDIVVRDSERIIIIDTKWKILNDDYDSNYGISQSDLYQMYAYAKKYNSNHICLVYPLNRTRKGIEETLEFNYDEDTKLNIFFLDLENTQESLKKLKDVIEKPPKY